MLLAGGRHVYQYHRGYVTSHRQCVQRCEYIYGCNGPHVLYLSHKRTMMNIADSCPDPLQEPLATSGSPPPHDSPHTTALALDQALKQLRDHKEEGGNLKHNQWLHTKDRQRLRMLQQDCVSLQTLLATLSNKLGQKLWARRTANQTSCTAPHESPNLQCDSRADKSHNTASHAMQVSADIMKQMRGLNTAKQPSGCKSLPRKRHKSYLHDSGDSDLSDDPMELWIDSDSDACFSHSHPHNPKLASVEAAVSDTLSPIRADVPSRRHGSPRLGHSSDVYSAPQKSLWNELEQPEWNENVEKPVGLPDSSPVPS